MIRRLFTLVVLSVVITGQPVAGQIQHTAPGYTESEIKAAFIVNLFAFIQWPEGLSPSHLCVSQSNAISSALTALLAARPALGLEMLSLDQSGQAPEHCDVLFISRGNSDGVKTPTQLGTPQLTISDQPGFAEQGGMVELERRPNRVGLVLNHNALSAAGFKVSSKLLSLARVVETGDSNGEQ